MTAYIRGNRPGILETTAMTLSVFFLAAGVPWAWTALEVRGQINTGGDIFVSLVFVSLAGFLAIQMNGHWARAWRVLGREPLLLIFVWWAAVSVVWSEDLAQSGRRAIAFIVTTYLGAHFVLRFRQFDILRILAGVLVGVVFVNLIWILFFPQYSGPPTGQSFNPADFDDRLTGIYTTPNSLGRVMALSVFTMLAALKLDRRRRPLYLIGLVASGFVLALSQSKTSLVVSVLTGALLIVFLVFRSRRQLFGAVVISVMGSAVISVALVLTNLGFITSALDRDVTLSGRVPLWKDLLEVIPERPIFGWGFNGYWNGWGSPSHEIWNLYSWGPPHGHNQFIDVMLTMGVIGLALYVALQVRTLTRATRYVRDIPGVFGLWPLTYCCFILLIDLTESGLVSRDITWFVFVAVVTLVSAKKTSVDEATRQNIPAPRSIHAG